MQEATIVERLREIAVTAEKQGLRFSFAANPLWQDAASLIERQQQVIDLLMKAVEPFVEEFEARRTAYIRRYPRHPAVGAANFDKMPDGWLMEKLEISMGVFRRAREAKEQAERILSQPNKEKE